MEVSTGPLGQGITNAVGMAIAERNLASMYNTEDFPSVFDNTTYVICGDGCLQEGISSEASSLAGHLGLGKLIVLYDDNEITIDGPTSLSFTEDVSARYRAYGWQVLEVKDVTMGIGALRKAVAEAQKESDKPTLIKIKTNIGYGSSKQDKSSAHGAPLGEEELAMTKAKYGQDPEKSFHVETDVSEFYKKRLSEQEKMYAEWTEMYKSYGEKYPEKTKELNRRFSHILPVHDLESVLPKFEYGKDSNQATRKYHNFCLNALAPIMPELMGGSADLTPSNLTALKCSGDFQRNSHYGRYLRFGVREHAMAAICNGIFAYGGYRPYCATFLNFAGYALGAIRVSALSQFGILYIMTHDSIGVGEDGPTHQPVEMLESLRSMPNIYTMRPADSNEMVGMYKVAMESHKTPSVICCSRGTVDALEFSDVEKAAKGGYAVLEEPNPDLILVASGSEVGCCVQAAKDLIESGIKTRVVSLPCQELFFNQSSEYQTSILPGNIPTLSVEASAVHGWHRLSHAQIGMTRYGLSAPMKKVFEHFGFTKENVAEKAKKLVEFYKGRTVPNLMDRPEL